ncbi:TniB family NTP-binding protein [Methylobacterium ajmalii]|uniref:TniB family NTP-binding protein n=1 Tax=Methylobacterium ajmalii TaxID=2738439 RepID=A0ABU9ZXR9_9HYPH
MSCAVVHSAIKIMETVRSKYAASKIDKDLEDAIRYLLVNHAFRANPTVMTIDENRPEGRLLVITGPSGAGKTKSLMRAVRRHPLLRGFDLDGPDGPLVSVTVTSPCTLKQLGRDTLRTVGYPLERDIKEHLVWERVRHRLMERKKALLIFDEMQHITQTANVFEQEKVANTIKDLMINRKWRSSIIVCGLPAVADFIHSDEQLRRRATFLQMKHLRMPDDNLGIADIVSGLAKVAGLTSQGDSEIAPRLIHAAGGRLGVAVEITQNAIEMALALSDFETGEADGELALLSTLGASTPGILTIQHFADAFRRRSGYASDENPFISRDWTSTMAPGPAPTDDSQRPRRRRSRKVSGGNVR